jgi:hypothetical protein
MAEVDWEAPYHAYESASDVPVLLSAVTVGDDPTRAAAWWQLWGNSAEPSKRRWSLRMATARGPAARARRRAVGGNPGASKIVVKAMRPPRRRSRLHALSTESLALVGGEERLHAAVLKWFGEPVALPVVTAQPAAVRAARRSRCPRRSPEPKLLTKAMTELAVEESREGCCEVPVQHSGLPRARDVSQPAGRVTSHRPGPASRPRWPSHRRLPDPAPAHDVR